MVLDEGCLREVADTQLLNRTRAVGLVCDHAYHRILLYFLVRHDAVSKVIDQMFFFRLQRRPDGLELLFDRLVVKEEGQNPTGSLKARGLSAAVHDAIAGVLENLNEQLGRVRRIACKRCGKDGECQLRKLAWVAANDAVDAILGATAEKFWRLPRLATI